MIDTNINTLALRNHEVPVTIYETYVEVEWGSFSMVIDIDTYTAIMEG